MGLVPKSTKSDVKFFAGLTIGKIMGIFICGGAGMLFGTFMSGGKQILLSLVFIGIFLIATSKAPSNPKITFFQGLKNWLRFIFSRKRYYGQYSEEYKELERRELVLESNKVRKKQIKKDNKA